ncbi:hypothetical protein K461DRAFT_29749 [Myriangium duriaei CBS 260.36]|uniref:Uncharacterized protein n=1 Tax=Myriangium duriaei CBS 260.36 TaxID=1168546 RepID=A0A9P4JEE9_9PEZI|nr:hypothetical protein K461DRAFT_29749 [Myriangium duriaei CBS 260.36]
MYQLDDEHDNRRVARDQCHNSLMRGGPPVRQRWTTIGVPAYTFQLSSRQSHGRHDDFQFSFVTDAFANEFKGSQEQGSEQITRRHVLISAEHVACEMRATSVHHEGLDDSNHCYIGLHASNWKAGATSRCTGKGSPQIIHRHGIRIISGERTMQFKAWIDLEHCSSTHWLD